MADPVAERISGPAIPVLRAAPAAAGVGTVGAVAAVVVVATAGIGSGELLGWQAALVVLGAAPSLVLGNLLSHKRPGLTIGPLMVAVGVVAVGVYALEAWAATARGPAPWPAARTVAAAAVGAWTWFYVPPVVLALTFPDGRLTSRRWRPVVVAAVAVPLVVQVTGALGARAPGGALAVVGAVATLSLLPLLVATVVSVVLRYRAGNGVVRRQLRWFAWSTSLVPVVLALCWVTYSLGGHAGTVVAVGLLALFTALPAAVFTAVVRHDLYDIDRLISRTVGYVTVSLLLAVLFTVVVVAAGTLVGRGSPVAVAAATLVATVSAVPLHRRVVRVVDRRFDRDRARALELADEFVGAVREGTREPEDVRDALRAALADPGLVVAFVPTAGGSATLVDPHGNPVDLAGLAVTDVGTAGHGSPDVLCRIGSGPRNSHRPHLVRAVAQAMRLPLEVARLRLEVDRALALTRESRARILAASDAASRRLERDLHDGAQQRLVALGMSLRLTQRHLDAADPVRAELDAAVDQVQATVAELRDIARGLGPGGLRAGLPSAVRTLAATVPVPVALDLDVGDDGHPLAITTTAYYVVAEALANAIKHADPQHVAVSVHDVGDTLVVRVRDDGRGGAVAHPNGGIGGLADRVAAADGRFTLTSPTGGGTTVQAELPLRGSSSSQDGDDRAHRGR